MGYPTAFPLPGPERDDPEQRYDLLADLTAVDYGGGKPIQVVYQLWSIGHKRALRIKCELPLAGLSIDSVVSDLERCELARAGGL